MLAELYLKNKYNSLKLYQYFIVAFSTDILKSSIPYRIVSQQ